MTEAEWLVCVDPTLMGDHLRDAGKLSERKARLFAVACSRIALPLMTDERSRQAVEIGEQFADGLVGQKALKAARRNAFAASKTRALASTCRHYAPAAEHAGIVALNVRMDTRRQNCWEMANATADCSNSLVFHVHGDAAGWADRKIQCHLLRDIFGNPFRPVAIDRRWLTSNVVDLANAIYSERAFDRMPILSDALTDAGCDSAEILSHCRSDGPHVRGCWVVDLLTGRK